MSKPVSQIHQLIIDDKTLWTDLIHGLKGIEKEGLRITSDGALSTAPHPVSLGAALTHPHITTDFSEALLELITPAMSDENELANYLTDLHKYVCTHIGDELLLAASMPVGDLHDSVIPIAAYGSSNVGKMKHIYRRGLSHRYGRCMQVIAGIHFNYSPPESFWPGFQQLMKNTSDLQSFRTNTYMGMIRNMQRYGWLILYLFGASPAVSKSFIESRRSVHTAAFERFQNATYYKPYATSLRMSEVGYVNPVQRMFHISFNSIEDYIRDLRKATSASFLDYERIGVHECGEYRQLSTSFLQIENEYYTPVRPKQSTISNERPTQALQHRGIQYIELRSLDIDFFEPTGISTETMRFLEAFNLFCLLQESPHHDMEHHAEINRNMLLAAIQGRAPALKLSNNGQEIRLQHWALELCQEMQPVCEMLDNGHDNRPYTTTLQKQIEAIRYPECTPSARMLSTLLDQKLSVTELVLQKSQEYTEYFKQNALNDSTRKQFDLQVQTSLQEFERLNNAHQIPFEQYLCNYFADGETTENQHALNNAVHHGQCCVQMNSRQS
ncbi:MAG: glutamate--cysteine ligase [Burkholderiales bacterium]|nr:glutamate--cysteine ligase [Nitrosomonas sp.]MCP5274530.1 glutamate--cysteine ligase [Burkholderiales bacterium]